MSPRWESDPALRTSVHKLLGACNEGQCVTLCWDDHGSLVGPPKIAALAPLENFIDAGQRRANAGVRGVRYVLEFTEAPASQVDAAIAAGDKNANAGTVTVSAHMRPVGAA